MKRKFNVTAALATTAAVGLLAGSAFAQGGPDTMGAPMVCPTTQMSPGHNDCVMPTAAAPGGGSFPGSFLVPGTNTSFAVHGFIQVDLVHDFGPHFGVLSYTPTGQPVEGPGVGATTYAAYAANGGTQFEADSSRPNIETRTPTAYGLLKTYIEFDFNQTSPQVSGNNNPVRLRQAYGTLGPWLIGQTLSAFADPGAYADTANAFQDIGMMITTNVRRPQIRYTWLAGNGLSVAASAEQPTPVGLVSAESAGDGTALAAGTANTLTGSNTGYNNWPAFVENVEWDQPWGHVRFAAGQEDNQFRAAAAGFGHGTNLQNFGYAFHLSGHLNTVGKDALRAGIVFDHGAPSFSSDMTQGGELYNSGTGARATVQEWAGYANYEHFFNGQWRANASFGYARFSGNPGWSSNTTLATLNKEFFDTNLNVIYSPVPQMDMFFEWQHQYRKVFSSADGTGNRIDFQTKFYF
jgi:Porin subfamily